MNKMNLKVPAGLFLYAIASILTLPSQGQDLPEQMYFSDDGQRLVLGGVPATDFYGQGEIRDVYLDFEDPDFWQFMSNNYGEDVYALATLRYKDLVLDSVGVAFKGQTSYSKAIKEGSNKLSFSVKLDEHIEGQDIDGYNNLNFNNAYEDDSYMIEVLYATLSGRRVPALRGNFIHLWLNGEDWGIYPNIQQLNGDFIKAWFPDKDGIRWRADNGEVPGGGNLNDRPPKPTSTGTGVETDSANGTVDSNSLDEPRPGSQWGDGTAALNYLGEDTASYQEHYTLKDSDMDNPWPHLSQVCRVLNETSLEDLADSLSKYMNLDATLWFLAQEIVFSDDDSYVYKGKMDYYLFLEESTGLMQPLEFDGNSAMKLRNVAWSPFMNEDSINYPLLNRLLAVPELRQRYIAHVKTLLEEVSEADTYNPLIDTYDALIRESVLNDPIATVTANQYDAAVENLRTFLEQRRTQILSHADFGTVGPEIQTPVRWVEGESGQIPSNGEECVITTQASHAEGLSGIFLHFGNGLHGPLEQVEMKDDGTAPDASAGDGIYSASIPGQMGGTLVRYYIEARAGDENKTVSFLPQGAAYEVFAYQVGTQSSGEADLVINEFLASNQQDRADEAGEYDDWIEIHNRGVQDIDLGAFFLSDDVFDLHKWQFPEMVLAGGEYLVIWADKDEEQGPLHASFKLSADGESVVLSDSLGNIIDMLSYGPQETDISSGRWPNATGDFTGMSTSFEAENTLQLTSSPFEALDAEVRAYPNPCTDMIFIEFPGMDANGTYASLQAPSSMLFLYNALGQLVLQEEYSGSLDMSALKSGLYILRMGDHSLKIQKE